MTRLVLDTSVLIDHLRGYRPASDFLQTVFRGDGEAFISTVSVLELYAARSMSGPRKEKAARDLISLFRVWPVDGEIAAKAGLLVRHHRDAGLSPLDAIIAATAMHLDAALVTRKIKNLRAVKELLVFDVPA